MITPLQGETITKLADALAVLDANIDREFVYNEDQVQIALKDFRDALSLLRSAQAKVEILCEPEIREAMEMWIAYVHGEWYRGRMLTGRECGEVIEKMQSALLRAQPSPQGGAETQDDLQVRVESLYEEIGGDLCSCQNMDSPLWCENCQRRIALIYSSFIRWREASPLSRGDHEALIEKADNLVQDALGAFESVMAVEHGRRVIADLREKAADTAHHPFLRSAWTDAADAFEAALRGDR